MFFDCITVSVSNKSLITQVYSNIVLIIEIIELFTGCYFSFLNLI